MGQIASHTTRAFMQLKMLLSFAFVMSADALLLHPHLPRQPTIAAENRAVSAWRARQVVATTTAVPTSAAHATHLHEEAQPPPSAMPGMQLINKSLTGLAPGRVRLLGRLSHHLFFALMLIGTVALGKGFMLAYLLIPLVTIVPHRGLRYEGKRNACTAMAGICVVFGLGNMERTLCASSASLMGILLNAVSAEFFVVVLSLLASYFHRMMHTNRHLRPFHHLHHTIKDVGADEHGHYHSKVDYCMVYLAPVVVLIAAQWLVSGLRPRLFFGTINALDLYFKHTHVLHCPVPQQMIPWIFFTDPSIYDKHAAHHANGGSNYNGPSYDLSFQSLVPPRWRSQ